MLRRFECVLYIFVNYFFAELMNSPILGAILTGCCAGVLHCTAGGPISFTVAAMERTTLLPLYGRIHTSLADTLIFLGVRNWLPNSVANVGEGPGGSGPLFLDQTEAQKAEKKNFETGFPPYFRVWKTGSTFICRSGSATVIFSSFLTAT